MPRALPILYLCLATLSALAAQSKGKNVLFIAVDDLRPQLGCYGAEWMQTPYIDGLAASGMRFDRAYCQQAVCGASRLSLMGGLYPTRTREQTFHVDGWRKRHPHLRTLNQHFKLNGYNTIGLGKIYHGTSGPGVDEPRWSSYLKVNAPEYVLPESNAALEAFRKDGGKGGTHDPPKGPTTEAADVSDDTYGDGRRAARACTVLGEIAAAGEPFFLAVGFTKPHLPFVAPQKYWDLYDRSQFAMPDNRGLPPGYPDYAANLPAYEMKKYSDYEGEMPTDFSEELNQRLLHGYAAATSYADACIGRVLEALESNGLADDTVVVLWGDHGWKLGDHSSWCKHTNLECDTRVPLIVRSPGHDAGVSNRLVELIDLYPTLCELTGVKAPPHLQGRSFVKLLADPTAGHRSAAYSSYPARKDLGHSIRFANYRYTEWHDPDGKPTGQAVLTNLKDDPGEETNVIDDPAHSEALAKGKKLLANAIETANPGRGPSLKEAAAKFPIGVGTDWGITSRGADAQLLKHHFDMITPENCMKSTVVQKQEGVWDFDRADKLVEWARKSDIDICGHCLVWARPGTTPAWFFKDGDARVSAEVLDARLKTHVETVVGRYQGKIAMWDVVNEALADADSEYLRDNPWCDVMGEEFIVKAFQYAKAADPDALLIYNDYRCDHPGKLAKLVRLISSCREKGAPIDALGLQAHYEYGMIPYEGIEAAIKAMRKIGVKVVFSELDMDVTTRARWYHDNGAHREELKTWDPYPRPTAPADVLASQAEQYGKLFEIIDRNADNVARVTFWNLHDGQSWLNGWPWERTNHPLLFDRQRRPKPALQSVVEVLSTP